METSMKDLAGMLFQKESTWRERRPELCHSLWRFWRRMEWLCQEEKELDRLEEELPFTTFMGGWKS